jgi:hypothetical protein
LAVQKERAKAAEILNQLIAESEELKKITNEILRTQQKNDKMKEIIANASAQGQGKTGKSANKSSEIRRQNKGQTEDMEYEQTERTKRTLVLNSSDSDTEKNKTRITRNQEFSDDEEEVMSEEDHSFGISSPKSGSSAKYDQDAFLKTIDKESF